MNTVITEFNNTLEEFMTKLVNQFPQEKKIKSYLSSFKITKMCTVELPIKIFMGGCIYFEEQIKNRDSDFFLNKKEFISKVQKSSSFADDIGLINYWNDLSEVSKKSIWDYIQTLYVMGEMYINKNTDMIKSINNIYNNFTQDEINEINTNNKLSDNLLSKMNE